MSLLTVSSLMILMISFLFIRIVHPLAAGLALLVQTILICIASGLQTKSMWYSYILFLIFLGAMLVLFIYVASVASNEAFNFSISAAISVTVVMITVMIGVLATPMVTAIKVSLEPSFLSSTEFVSSQQLTLSMIYNPIVINLTAFVIIYLLMTLIVTVKLTCMYLGPLRLS